MPFKKFLGSKRAIRPIEKTGVSSDESENDVKRKNSEQIETCIKDGRQVEKIFMYVAMKYAITLESHYL